MVTIKDRSVESVSVTLTDFEARTLFKAIGLTSISEDIENLGDEKQAPALNDIYEELLSFLE